MASEPKKRCVKCQKEKIERRFWKMKNGERCDMCKDCLTAYIDNRNPKTYLWILEKFDVPYVEHVWVNLTNEAYLRDPASFGSTSVIGNYIRSMSLSQYKECGYADSDRLNHEYKQEQEEIYNRKIQAIAMNEEEEKELKRQLEAGEISTAEYKTRSSLTAFNEAQEEKAAADRKSSKFVTTVDDAENAIAADLTDEDIKYLSMKWGTLYKPSEWITMEKLYNEYAAENDLNTDRRETLKKICKTSLKMDQAIDVGDMQDYKNLSMVYEQLRKSAKFTEMQNHEEEVRDLDSIGELVKFIEREGGVIPQQFDPINDPQDKVDFAIRDIKNYLRRLVVDEQGLGDIIESFIQKAEKQKTETVEGILATDFDVQNEITQQDAEEFADFRLQQIEEESRQLIEEFAENGS